MNNQVSLPHPREAERLAQSWAFSLALHGLAVGLAVAMLSDLHLVPEPEPFKWEVSMVEAEAPRETAAEPASAPARAAPQPVASPQVPPEPPRPQPMVAAVTPPPPAPVVQPQVIPPPPKVAEPPPPVVPSTPVMTHSQPAVEVPKPPPQPEPKAVETPVQAEPPPPPVIPSTPVMAHSQPAVEVPKPALQPESKAVETSPVQAEPAPPQHAQPTQQAMIASAAPSPAPSQTQVPTPTATPTPMQKMDTPPVQEPAPAAADPAPARDAPSHAPAPIQEASVRGPSNPPVAHAGPPAKADFGWLAHTLWERVGHLKRYPHVARLRHVEGRVLLRAVITADGHLAKAEIVESSGSQVLDEDAMETLRKACPLHLDRPLGRPEVVVQIPINYRLH